ncbi:hypothetical protein GCM10010335_68340 [Streptomyces galbus]|nr:hypothetical protein GCM10010335_68340 [Streptomyces galbus]
MRATILEDLRAATARGYAEAVAQATMLDVALYHAAAFPSVFDGVSEQERTARRTTACRRAAHESLPSIVRSQRPQRSERKTTPTTTHAQRQPYESRNARSTSSSRAPREQARCGKKGPDAKVLRRCRRAPHASPARPLGVRPGRHPSTPVPRRSGAAGARLSTFYRRRRTSRR